MSLRWVGDRSGRILFAYGAICAFLSMWISNTATTRHDVPHRPGHRPDHGRHLGPRGRSVRPTR